MNFIVVSEARADFITAAELADRVLIAEIEWLEEETIDSQRQWVGEDSPGYHLAWATVAQRARESGIQVRGQFGGKPALADAHAARRAILYVLKHFEVVDSILLIRDMDNQYERREGLQQARDRDSSGKAIIIGTANPERECWVISGFEPESPTEQNVIDAETQKLGSNPCLRSHDLTAGGDNQALRSPKRVLKALTSDSWERQRKCWQVTSLALLMERGEDNGLSDYLDEIKQLLVPLISGITGGPDSHEN